MDDFEIPDPEVVGAVAEAALQYRKDHPNATIEEIVAFNLGWAAASQFWRGRD